MQFSSLASSAQGGSGRYPAHPYTGHSSMLAGFWLSGIALPICRKFGSN